MKKAKRLKERQKVINLYKKGMTKKEIPYHTNYSYVSVCRILKEEGFGRKDLTDKKYSVASKAYEYYSREGVTLDDVGEKFGFSWVEVRTMFIRNGFEIKPQGISAKIENEDYFETIDTPEKAYLLGFINCDGSILKFTEKSKRVSVSVQSDDVSVLHFLVDELGMPRDYVKNYNINTRSFSKVEINSPKVFDDLLDKGVEERKMGRKRLPLNVPFEFYPDLIRGIFDADGSLKGVDVFSVSAGGTLCYELSDFLNETLDLKTKPPVYLESPREDKPHWSSIPRLRAGINESKVIFEYIHQQNGFCLKRKLPTYMRINSPTRE